MPVQQDIVRRSRLHPILLVRCLRTVGRAAHSSIPIPSVGQGLPRSDHRLNESAFRGETRIFDSKTRQATSLEFLMNAYSRHENLLSFVSRQWDRTVSLKSDARRPPAQLTMAILHNPYLVSQE
jgi:hypothetical protein